MDFLLPQKEEENEKLKYFSGKRRGQLRKGKEMKCHVTYGGRRVRGCP